MPIFATIDGCDVPVAEGVSTDITRKNLTMQVRKKKIKTPELKRFVSLPISAQEAPMAFSGNWKSTRSFWQLLVPLLVSWSQVKDSLELMIGRSGLVHPSGT